MTPTEPGPPATERVVTKKLPWSGDPATRISDCKSPSNDSMFERKQGLSGSSAHSSFHVNEYWLAAVPSPLEISLNRVRTPSTQKLQSSSPTGQSGFICSL